MFRNKLHKCSLTILNKYLQNGPNEMEVNWNKSENNGSEKLHKKHREEDIIIP